MNTKPNIPHADLIRAVLDGKTVQCRDIKFRGEPPTVPGFQYVDCIDATSDWMGMPRTPVNLAQAAIDLMVNNAPDYEFRLKPESIVSWHPVFSSGFVDQGFATRDEALAVSRDQPDFRKILRLERDPDTLKVIDARTEAP